MYRDEELCVIIILLNQLAELFLKLNVKWMMVANKQQSLMSFEFLP